MKNLHAKILLTCLFSVWFCIKANAKANYPKAKSEIATYKQIKIFQKQNPSKIPIKP